MRVRPLLKLPFTVVFGLVKLLFWPVVLLGLGWLLLPWSWFAAEAGLVGAYTVAVLLVWRVTWRGAVRSLARGELVIKRAESDRDPGRPR